MFHSLYEGQKKNPSFQGHDTFLIQYVLKKGFTVMVKILRTRSNYSFLDKSSA